MGMIGHAFGKRSLLLRREPQLSGGSLAALRRRRRLALGLRSWGRGLWMLSKSWRGELPQPIHEKRPGVGCVKLRGACGEGRALVIRVGVILLGGDGVRNGVRGNGAKLVIGA